MPPKYSLAGSRRKSVFQSSVNNTALGEASVQAVELERLEQEITLTLQDIDKSFAQSHKIINDKLIPIVKKYHASSRKVWSGVHFWKSLLETSANVELRGYEEAVEGVEGVDDVVVDQEDLSMRDSNEQMSPVKVDTAGTNHDILMESTSHGQEQFEKRYTENLHNNTSDPDTSTPRKLRDNPIIPHEKKTYAVGFDTTDSILPPVPNANISNTNNGTDVNQTTPTLIRHNTDNNHTDESRHYLMHNNLDTNYKVQVSPRKARNQATVNSLTPRKHISKKRKSMIAQQFDSSPFDIETPQLQSEVQFSPLKGRESPLRRPTRQSLPPQDENTTQRFPHTPRYGASGNLLRTPAHVNQVANRYSQNFESSVQIPTTLDDSEDPAPNISPPVTLNFATAASVSNVRRTPARQAAQNIVKDILNNVSGMNDTTQDHEFHDAVSRIDETRPMDDFDAYLDNPREKEKDGEWSDS